MLLFGSIAVKGSCVIWFLLQSGDRALVLCFVEFVDSKCALTAMEALQGKFCLSIINRIVTDIL